MVATIVYWCNVSVGLQDTVPLVLSKSWRTSPMTARLHPVASPGPVLLSFSWLPKYHDF